MPPMKGGPNGGPTGQWRGRAADAERMAREFPALAGLLARPESRRQVLRLMAAGMALGGLAGCDPSDPDGRYTPAVRQAPNIVPGLPNRYASVLAEGGAGAGIVVTQLDGRPIKVDGNPAHPGSLGGSSIHGQALLLDFYDPDRESGVLERGQVSTWQGLLRAALSRRAALAADGGAGLRIVVGRVASPTLGAALEDALRRYPRAQLVQWEAAGRENAERGLLLAYGRPAALLPRPAAADVVLALDSDLLSGAPGHLRHARDFAGRRNPVRATEAGARMSRVHAAETLPTAIGFAADHRAPAGPAELEQAAVWLADAILGGGAAADAPPWLRAAIADLRRAGGGGLVHAGPGLSAGAHALVHRVNERLGGRGRSFDLIEPFAALPAPPPDAMAALTAEMAAGHVTDLWVLEGNPAYTAPGFADAMAKVPFSVSSAPAPDETARLAAWHVPQAHPFEAWGDLRGHDGTAAIQQPQSLPLHGGLSAPALLAALQGLPETADEERVRATWRELDEDGWRDALAAGVLPNSAFAPIAVAPVAAPAPSVGSVPGHERPGPNLRLLIRPDPNLRDGRDANNAWLQELPRPVGKLAWGNPFLLAPATARRLGLENGDEIEVSVGGARAAAPVWIIPGQAPDCIVGWLGGGRRAAGAVGDGVGVDLTPLRAAPDAPFDLRRTGRNLRVASTDHHNILEVDREAVDQVVRHATLAEFAAGAALPPAGSRPRIDEPRPPGPAAQGLAAQGLAAWGMSVDLNACIGCNACVVACQAENNVPVVGREQMLLGREMHWLRIDRYHEGNEDAPDSFLQPMLCMHCESAPCEPVCPVEASIHDEEGLNLQVYNRCIGTRFCSNNCPYKVRRFNFGAWAAEEHRPPISRNPDVTVRSRGVMEKCTFCVQRIAQARIEHDRDGARERVVTACQAACPTRAFTFGDLNDPDSAVRRRRHSPIGYALLADQNTLPRLTYEARILNRDPAKPEPDGAGEAG